MVKKKDLCILHIGMPKTGSTTIQDNFFRFGVIDQRAVYTDLGVANQSGHLHGLFLEKHKKYHFFEQQNFSLSDIEKFQRETKQKLENSFLDHATSINILSGEDLFHSQDEAVLKMKEYLNKFFQKVLVIVYVRPVQSFSASAFQQLVKYHDIRKFDHQLIVHRYTNILRYDNAYGKENVQVIPFVPQKFFNNDILQDFCMHAGLLPQKSQIKQSNESLSKEAVSLLFTYNFHHSVKTDFKDKNAVIQNKLVETLRPIGKEKFQFSGKLIKSWVENHFQDDYKWLLERIPEEDKKYFEIDDSVKGISNEAELMAYATNHIDTLVSLIKPELIEFELKSHPQTVAKLVNALRIQIAKEMGL